MKIKINLQIFAIILVLILTKQIEVYAILMFFAFIHELAHMCVGLMLKLKPKELAVQPFGISVTFESVKNTEKNKIMIALAGPMINIILVLVFSFIHIKYQRMIINSNILLALFNLIPIYPLDGGRILKSLLNLKHKSKVSDEITNKISNTLIIIITVIASFLILIYKNIGLIILIGYLWIIVIRENKNYRIKKRVEKLLKSNKNA